MKAIVDARIKFLRDLCTIRVSGDLEKLQKKFASNLELVLTKCNEFWKNNREKSIDLLTCNYSDIKRSLIVSGDEFTISMAICHFINKHCLCFTYRNVELLGLRSDSHLKDIYNKDTSVFASTEIVHRFPIYRREKIIQHVLDIFEDKHFPTFQKLFITYDRKGYGEKIKKISEKHESIFEKLETLKDNISDIYDFIDDVKNSVDYATMKHEKETKEIIKCIEKVSDIVS